MRPLIEVIIHDLVSGKICYINGNLSKRKVGDSSLLALGEFEKNIDQIIYPKINFDGRLIKSISVPVDNKYLICINADASVFSQMKNLGEVFLNTIKDSQPESLFKNDWQEKLHVAIDDFLKKQGLKFDELNQFQKKILTKYLFDLGAFAEKNAADYVANILGLGRATIFKYLKEWRNDNEH
jgi:predicted transcriptional regulator YheO